MYVVHNRIEVGPADAEAFENAFTTSMRTTLGGVPGLRRSLLMRPARPGQPYVSTMEFDFQDDFKAWMKSDSFRAAHADAQAPACRRPRRSRPSRSSGTSSPDRTSPVELGETTSARLRPARSFADPAGVPLAVPSSAGWWSELGEPVMCVEPDLPAGLVDHGVVGPAQQHQVRQAGLAAVGPVDEVVGVAGDRLPSGSRGTGSAGPAAPVPSRSRR